MGIKIETLPEMCFACLETNEPGKYVIAIKRGETGYYPTTYDEMDLQKARDLAAHLNSKLEVTEAQAELMLTASMFGWGVLDRISNY